MDIVFQEIGRVSSGVSLENPRGWENSESLITVDPGLADALSGLFDFSHIIVVYYIDRVRDKLSGNPPPHSVHPRGRKDLPLVGLFATRSPARPNPIGISVVRLIKVEGNVLTVRGLDAIDGTPVLDVKPYLPQNDRIENPVIPEWAQVLARES